MVTHSPYSQVAQGTLSCSVSIHFTALSMMYPDGTLHLPVV